MSKSYEVGYRKPPKHTQFKKGQSGNRKGRRKGSISLLTTLSDMMAETVVVREGDNVRRLSRIKAMLLSLWNQASKGDARAAKSVLALLEQAGLMKPGDTPTSLKLIFVSPDGTESSGPQKLTLEHQPAPAHRK